MLKELECSELSDGRIAIAQESKLTNLNIKPINLKENKMSSNSLNSQNMKLEVVVLPVSDVDKAKDFYKTLGWRLDADFVTDEDFRVVQLTPPGSEASIIFGSGVTLAAPGSVQGLYLIVYDIEAARAELVERGVEVSEVFHDVGGVFHHAGTEGRVPGPDPQRRDYASFASFSDPNGNGWLLQEVKKRAPGR
ncbi:MAG: VOC family protein [Nostoc sp.]|uniref:VOC family protein n=1 Tax=Nostoc sp. TaxID=1180 RepID=UPI002FF60A21